MKLGTYLRLSVWEILLVGVAAVSLTYTLLDSFYIDPALQYSPVPGVLAAVLIVALFLAAWNRRSARIGGVVIALCCIVGLFVSTALSDTSLLTDTEENYFYFALVCVIGPLVTFGLSRMRWGTAVLFGVGSFVCAWMQFFYEFDEFLWTILFIISAAMLIIYKNYQLSARQATSVRRLSFSAGFGVSVLAVALSAGLACAVWFGIIAPLGPEALEIKLIQEYRALETQLVLGTSAEEMTPNMDLTSDQTIDLERTTDDLWEDESGRQMDAPEDDPDEAEEEESGSVTGFNMQSVQEIYELITYDEDTRNWAIGVLVLVVLLIVGYFVGRRIYRTKRLERFQQLPNDEQVQAIYLFVMKKMKRIGYAVPEGVTLLEFSRNNAETLRAFQEESGVGFDEVTSMYVSSVYGKRIPTDGEALRAGEFYRSFWKVARKKLGNVKYFFKSFFL